ncbi:carbohydrate ABC transporter permease [Natronosporangium hydrolyticum]|uniref:Carbohydrate ABC transporter permease n=1 Tax=Natronosporangium hydrolyticum TaxID=2811111 RepID=A0A895YK40_9ACTN|nr:carbohydrate ABC transporter permease [Natronosporangium hydrolyticum]QSB16402.1 carbohydrate ABC transporter permease [Natronosporangium hydrolyticum]
MSTTPIVTKVPPPRGRRQPWEEKPSAAGQTGKGAVLTFVVLAVLFPMWVIVVTSLSPREAINNAGGLVIVPQGLDFSAYVAIFSGGRVTRALGVSMFLATAGTALSVVLTILAAYGLSRQGSFGHRTLLFVFLLTFFIYPSLIPSYLVVTGLGLRDNLLALILPTAVSAFNLIVMRAFFMNLPQDLIESARIDGASELRILLQIVMPLSRAVIAVISLFYAVGYWNAFFNAMLYIQNRDLDPIQRVLQQYVLAGQAPPLRGDVANLPGVASVPPSLAIQMAVVVVTIVPCVVIYPFVQRHFVKGVIIGAVKG